MVYDVTMLKAFYASYKGKMEHVRAILQRPLTLAEKILYTHLFDEKGVKDYKRGEDYVNFRPDRVAMQDATAQMALLQFMNAGREQVAVPSTVHCDHLIQAYRGAREDIATATKTNEEVYDFLRDVSSRYGIGFWQPGAGIIHQVVLENYAFPGGMMVGTDSHTPNAGGLGMVAIGVGGADAVDVMTGMEWELKMPRLIGVHLKGELSGWAAPKDVILKLAGILTVKGGTNAIIEYFGPGTASLSATGKATICNMGAEVGATTSLFPYDDRMATYLKATGREEVAEMADSVAGDLRADADIMIAPEKYYDRVIEIDLSRLEPYINGPFTPDAATPISEFAEKVLVNGYPRKMEVGLIGSCTNSSYQDLSRAVSLARQVEEKHLKVAAPLIVNPGSERIRATAERDGMIGTFEKVGATIMANACGPCIGQWKRETDNPTRKNSIVTSFNRNFAKRADGNPNTYAFVASPELTMALTIAGDLCFNPLTDVLVNREGEKVKLSEPVGEELPPKGFAEGSEGYIAPSSEKVEINVNPHSQRLQLLQPFPAWASSSPAWAVELQRPAPRAQLERARKTLSVPSARQRRCGRVARPRPTSSAPTAARCCPSPRARARSASPAPSATPRWRHAPSSYTIGRIKTEAPCGDLGFFERGIGAAPLSHLCHAVAGELLGQRFGRHGHNRVELGVHLGNTLHLEFAHQVAAAHHVHWLTQSTQVIERVLVRHQDIGGLAALDRAGLAA